MSDPKDKTRLTNDTSREKSGCVLRWIAFGPKWLKYVIGKGQRDDGIAGRHDHDQRHPGNNS